MIQKFNEFITEKYNQTQLADAKRKISYTFFNKDGIEFLVEFNSINNDGDYEREYFVLNKDGNKSYEKIEVSDIFSLIKKITDITIKFLEKYRPDELKIFHIPTYEEKVKVNKEEDSDYWETHTTKRAKIHKRFLEKKIPFEYAYELNGSISTIEKRF